MWDAKIDGAIFIIAAHLSVSEKYSGWRDGGRREGGSIKTKLGREGGLAGGGCGAIAQVIFLNSGSRS